MRVLRLDPALRSGTKGKLNGFESVVDNGENIINLACLWPISAWRDWIKWQKPFLFNEISNYLVDQAAQ